MKRSEKLTLNAKRHAWLSACSLVVSAALVCWVPAAVLSGYSDPGGIAVPAAVGALAFAIIGLVVCICLLLEAIRLARLARTERAWEYEREVRPRL